LTRLVEEAPDGTDWLHEIKFDGYRMHARIDGDKIQLLTRTGPDWSRRYKRTIEALRSLKVKPAYLDGKLCALNADGVPVFTGYASPSAPTDHTHRGARLLIWWPTLASWK
jgi:ATP-dependent DNA ligase